MAQRNKGAHGAPTKGAVVPTTANAAPAAPATVVPTWALPAMPTVATMPAATGAPGTITVNPAAPAAAKALTRNTARSRYILLAMAYNGQPLATFRQVAQANGNYLHGYVGANKPSVFNAAFAPNATKPQHAKPQQFSGWLSWLTRNGIVTVHQ